MVFKDNKRCYLYQIKIIDGLNLAYTYFSNPISCSDDNKGLVGYMRMA